MLRAADYFEVGVATGDAGRVLTLAGELDLASGELLRQEARRLPTTPQLPLIVDVRFLDFVDVAGVRALLDACALVAEQGSEVSLTRTQPAVDLAFRYIRSAHQLRVTA
jgi:anti-anti-sigma factor